MLTCLGGVGLSDAFTLEVMFSGFIMVMFCPIYNEYSVYYCVFGSCRQGKHRAKLEDRMASHQVRGKYNVYLVFQLCRLLRINVHSRSKSANSELVTVELLKIYCLPDLLYATEAISLTATDMRILDNCISRALYKIFSVSDNENMLHMRHCLGLPSLMNMIENRCFNLWLGY